MTLVTLACLALLVQPCDHMDLREQLRLTLHTAIEAVHEREPLDLELTVSNTSDCPARVSMTLSPVYAAYFAIAYRRLPDSSTVWTAPTSWRGPGDAPFEYLQLAPGERRGFKYTVAADPGVGRFVLDRPGDYEMSVRVQGRGLDSPVAFESNSVRIHALPAPAVEAGPMRDFWDVDMAYLAQADDAQMAPGTSATFARAEAFLARYPNSLYARAAKRGLQRALEVFIRDGLAKAEHRALWERVRLR